jgi:hypothetical protein
MAKAEQSATQALVRVAVGIDLAVLFFGALALRGVGAIEGVWLWSGVGASVVVLLIIMRTAPSTFSLWLGHVFHLALLGLFAIDPVAGVSMLVPLGYWLFAAIRGPQLDGMARGDQA